MNSLPFRQLKSFLQILIGVQYECLCRRKVRKMSVYSEKSPGHLSGGLAVYRGYLSEKLESSLLFKHLRYVFQ